MESKLLGSEYLDYYKYVIILGVSCLSEGLGL